MMLFLLSVYADVFLKLRAVPFYFHMKLTHNMLRRPIIQFKSLIVYDVEIMKMPEVAKFEHLKQLLVYSAKSVKNKWTPERAQQSKIKQQSYLVLRLFFGQCYVSCAMVLCVKWVLLYFFALEQSKSFFTVELLIHFGFFQPSRMRKSHARALKSSRD